MKGALLTEFYSWKKKRIGFTLAVIVAAVASSFSEILFYALFGVLLLLNFISGLIAFKADGGQAAAEYNTALPVSDFQRVAAKYTVLLFENVIMWAGYAFACLRTEIAMNGDWYTEYELDAAMSHRAVFVISALSIAFVLWFWLNYKLKSCKVLKNILLFIPFSLAMCYIHIEYEFLDVSSIFRDELWILPSAVISAVLLLVAGVPIAAVLSKSKGCSKKLKAVAAVCVVLVVPVSVLLAVLNEYGYFRYNAPLGFIYNNSEDKYTEKYEFIIDTELTPPTEVQLARREELLEFLKGAGSQDFAGKNLKTCANLLKNSGFSGEHDIGFASYSLYDIECSLSWDANDAQNAMLNDMLSSAENEKVTDFAVMAEIGEIYLETSSQAELEKLMSDFKACKSNRELAETFALSGMVPNYVEEMVVEDMDSIRREYYFSGVIESYKDTEELQSFTINVIIAGNKVIAADYMVF